MSTIHIEHDDNSFVAEDLGDVPVSSVKRHDFLLCKIVGHSHVIARDVENGLVVLWDCEGRGHTYGEAQLVHVARPEAVRNREFGPNDRKEFLDDDEEIIEATG